MSVMVMELWVLGDKKHFEHSRHFRFLKYFGNIASLVCRIMTKWKKRVPWPLTTFLVIEHAEI